MKKTGLHFCLIFLFSFFSFSSLAQPGRFWQPAQESQVGQKAFLRHTRPAAYLMYQLNENQLRRFLQQTPLERNIPAALSGKQLELPLPNGSWASFRIVESPVMEDGLARRYPGIKTYCGQGITDPAATLRFDISPYGANFMILSPALGVVYIDAADEAQQLYLVYNKKDLTDPGRFKCGVNTEALNIPAPSAPAQRNADDGTRRTYRLALAGTGEYSQFHTTPADNTDALRRQRVLAAMTTVVNRLNAIYEGEFAIRFVLVNNNDQLIFLNPATDPYETVADTLFMPFPTNQTAVDNRIGTNNYDIGHLLHRGLADGRGEFRSVCNASLKARGFSATDAPQGDPLVVDYVCHEIGHQFDARHTMVSVNINNPTAAEPGSGSTIMAYAGVENAGPFVQLNSDPYFHGLSIEQVANFMKNATTGNSCAQALATGNFAPSVTAFPDFTIPRSTPFVLTGTASDPNGDALTYCWEQTDGWATGAVISPTATATAGPVFRSLLPTTNNFRNFPDLNTILAGNLANTWEALPSVARTLNFRLTVRDNRAGGSANRSDDVVITVNGASGPFAVTAPNTATLWTQNSIQTISWSVNGTNAAPVNCANVRILLSTDGGQTFPTVLAANTPNDGSESVSIPGIISNTCRIRVEAIGNIFFDISNANFSIVPCSAPMGLLVNNLTSSSAGVSWSPVPSAVSYNIEVKPVGTSNWTVVAANYFQTSITITNLNPGTGYDWRVRATCQSGIISSFSSGSFGTTGGSPCINAFEPNETRAAAAAAPINSNISAAITTSTDRDWYSFTVNGTTNFNITLTNLPLDYDMIFYNASGGIIGSSAAGGTTNESIILSNQPAGTYFVEVYGYNGLNSNACYTLNIGAVVQNCVSNLEPNETQATAIPVSANTNITAGIGSATDNDWYSFTTTATGNFNITLTNLPLDYDIQLYNASGGFILGSTNGSNTSETIAVTGQPAGTYFVRVYGFSGAFNTTSCYNLNIGVTLASSCQSNADLNANESTSQAASIPLGTPINGLINPVGDNDYYSFFVSSAGTVTVTLTNLPFDYDLRVFNSAGTQVGSSLNGGNNNESTTFSAPFGVYYIQVFGYNNAFSASSCYTVQANISFPRGTQNLTVNKQNGNGNVQVKLFPNPVNQSLNIGLEGIKEKASAVLTDVNGRVFITRVVANGNTRISTASLIPGIYMVRIINQAGETIYTGKIMKE